MASIIHIEFPYKNLIHHVNIPVKNLDIDHYETVWDWWFRPDDMPRIKELFEVTGKKNKRNEPTVNDICINVYANEYEDAPCCEIHTNIKARIV